MAALSYAICLAIFNSLWQAAILLCGYLTLNKIFAGKLSPLAKRNFLFLLISTQLLLFIITTAFYFSLPVERTGADAIAQAAERWLPGISFQSLSPWLVTIYLLMIAFKMMKQWYSWKLFRQQYKSGLVKASVDLKLFTQSKAYHFGIKRKVKLWFSNNINTPVTFGFLRPVIVLPVSLVNNISIEQAETLILHELAHISSNDFLLNWYLVAIETIFFFNPFIGSLCKKIRLEREKYCDTTVIAFRYSPLLYAQTLLQAAQIKPLAAGFPLAAIQQKKQLLQRIGFFTGELNFNRTRKINIALPLLALCLLFAGSLSLLQKVKPSEPRESVLAMASSNMPISLSAVPVEAKALHFASELVNNFDDRKLQALVDETEKQKPALEKQLKDMEPLIRSIQSQAQAISEDALAQIKIQPVSFNENTTGNTRQIIVREEQSGSKAAVIKVYRLVNINGEWVMEPEWMLSAREKADSALKTIDTLSTKLQLLNEQ